MLEGDGADIESASLAPEPSSPAQDSLPVPSESVVEPLKPTIFSKVPKKLSKYSGHNFTESKKWSRVLVEVIDHHKIVTPEGFLDMDRMEAIALSEYYGRKAKEFKGELPKDIGNDSQYKEDSLSLGSEEALKLALYRKDLKAEENEEKEQQIQSAIGKLDQFKDGKLN